MMAELFFYVYPLGASNVLSLSIVYSFLVSCLLLIPSDHFHIL